MHSFIQRRRVPLFASSAPGGVGWAVFNVFQAAAGP